MADTDFIFISHAPEDREEAERVASYYERLGVRIRAGEQASLDDSAAVIVLLSAAATGARAVREETDRAAQQNKPIFPIRLSAFQPGDALPALPPESDWTNAFGPEAQANITALGECLQALLRDRQSEASPFAAPPPSPFAQPPAPAFPPAAPPPFAPPPPELEYQPYAGHGYDAPERPKSNVMRSVLIGVGVIVLLFVAYNVFDYIRYQQRVAENDAAMRAAVSGSGGSSSGSSATSSGESPLLGRWCVPDGSYSRFDAGGQMVNYNAGQSEQQGTYQIIQDRVNIRVGGVVATMRFAISGDSVTFTDTSGRAAPFTATRC